MIYIDIIYSSSGKQDLIYFVNKDNCGYNPTEEFIQSYGEILTQSNEILERYKFSQVGCSLLSSHLGLDSNIGLYEVFSHFFDGKVKNDFDMLQAIFSGFIFDSKFCYCLKINATFCWFIVEDSKFKILGTMQFSENISKFTVGKFFKRLRYAIALSGINLAKVKFLYWGRDENFGFEDYILSYDYLSDFFGKIDGLKNLSCENTIRLLSNDVKLQMNLTAEMVINSLNESFKTLGIREEDGVLYSDNVFYKDYSSIKSSVVNSLECTYGIILDCEGKKGLNGDLNEGFGELGGIIYCKYNNILLNLDVFYCDENLLSDTLDMVIRNIQHYTSRLKPINIIVFGKSDNIMFTASVEKNCSKLMRKAIANNTRFIDCRDFILDNIDTEKIDGFKLTNIAKSLGVLPVYPKHNPINDARTLFNILAKILQTSGKFVV